MDTANTERVRAMYGAFERGDVPFVLQALAADVHWFEADGFPHRGEYVRDDRITNFRQFTDTAIVREAIV